MSEWLWLLVGIPSVILPATLYAFIGRQADRDVEKFVKAHPGLNLMGGGRMFQEIDQWQRQQEQQRFRERLGQ